MKKLIFALLFLCSCGKYNPILEQPEVPQVWKTTYEADKDFVFKDRFWELFEDPLLNALEEQAIEANFDLQIAFHRIEEARALVSKEHAKRLPRVGLDASVAADEALINPRAFGSPHHVERVQQRTYNFLADFTYEIDLWGKFKAEETSALHRAEATDWEYAFVYQTLVTDVATHYFLLRTLEEETRFLKQAIESRQDTVNLNSCRAKAGLDPEIDLSRAKLELALAQTDLEEANERHALLQNALALLLGKPASLWSFPEGHLPLKLPPLPEMLPSEVLMRRADVQKQWSLVAAGRSDVEVALKDFFPSFPLTAALGLSSPMLKHLYEWQGRYWAFAFNALAPLFDGGKRRAQVDQAKARFQATFAAYQKTVNGAFQDVEDALSVLHYSHLQYEAQCRALESAQDTAYLAKGRYDKGLISYLLVADSEHTSLNIAKRTIGLQGKQLLAWVRLMRALGVNNSSS